MHWVFYVVAAAVTALAIYVQMKRVDRAARTEAEPEAGTPTERKAEKEKKPAA